MLIRITLLIALVTLAATAVVAGPGHDHSKDHKAVKEATAAAKTALTAELGKPAPDFTLTDLEGNKHTLSEYVKDGKIVVLEWFNPDCPFVKKHHVTFGSMAKTQKEFAEKDVVWLAINSGAPGKQGAGMERNLKAVKDYGVAYPLLLDESGQVGKMYGAKTTPQMYIIQDGVLVFNGPLDDNRTPVTLGDTNYVRDVLNQCCNGKEVDPQQIKSYGCSVKYAS